MADEVELSEVDYKLQYTGEELDKILVAAKEIKSTYDKMKRVQAGCENISLSAAGADTIEVIDFSIAFDDVPHVIIMPIYDKGSAKIDMLSVTDTSFKVHVTAKDNESNTRIYWIATEQQPCKVI